METTTTPSAICELCQQESDRLVERRCQSCRRRIDRADPFNKAHYTGLPPRYARACPADLELADGRILQPWGSSYLLSGPNGRGKTHLSCALAEVVRQDPRRRIAFYSWPRVLVELRRGYDLQSGHPDKLRGRLICDALAAADLAVIDDLGAEKTTCENLGRIQEELFLVLDERYRKCSQTVITTNLPPFRSIASWPEAKNGMLLREYLGERISNRMLEMCELVLLTGEDRRKS